MLVRQVKIIMYVQSTVISVMIWA